MPIYALFTLFLLLLEVSWRKGKMVYIVSSRLDRKNDTGNEGEDVALSIKCQLKHCFPKST